MSRPALRADFQHYYGWVLDDLLAGGMKPSLIADYAVELPRGARIWVHMGGPAAVSAETEMLMGVEYMLKLLGYQNGGNKGKEPEVRAYPKSVKEQERDANKVTARALRWRARHMKNE